MSAATAIAHLSSGTGTQSCLMLRSLTLELKQISFITKLEATQLAMGKVIFRVRNQYENWSNGHSSTSGEAKVEMGVWLNPKN